MKEERKKKCRCTVCGWIFVNFFFFLHSTLTMNPFPDVESGSETEREAGSVYKVQELGVAIRMGVWESVVEAGQ